MWEFLQRRWLLVAMMLLIPLGICIGLRAQPATVSSFPRTAVQIVSGVMTAVILFLMSVTLENRRLIRSLRSPGPMLWGTFVCYVLIPMTAMLSLPFQQPRDFAIGLMVITSVPSTLAAASVWTRKAGGNDATSLLITIITNAACFLVTPFWLQLALENSMELNAGKMITQLFMTALLPILVGQAFRSWPRFRTFADNSKRGFGALAQVCILLIIFWASVQTGVKIKAGTSTTDGIQIQSVVIVWGTCVAVHLLGVIAGFLGGRLFGFRREDIVGIVFAGSQKTLPIGLFVAASLTGDAPLALLPVLMYHASQLILDTFMLSPLQIWVSRQVDSPIMPS